MLEVVTTAAETIGITPEQADGALRIIINFLHAEGPSEKVERLAGEIGVASYIDAAPAKQGGLMGVLGGLLGAGGGAMAAFSQLQALGLGFDQIQATVRHLIDVGRTKVGDEEVDSIIDAIPGLGQLL